MYQSIQSIFVNRFGHWVRKGGISILDQGLFSGANFILNVFLARWLSPSSYGIFSIAFAIYLFVTGFYNAIILEPMSVLGPANYTDRLKNYISSQFQIHAIFTIPVGLILIIVSFIVFIVSNNYELALALVSVGIVLPFMLLPWLSRRAFYVMQNPIGAFIGSLCYFFLLIFGMFFIHYWGIESQFSWYFLMGLSGFLCTLFSFWITKFKYCFDSEYIKIIKNQWAFSKWIVVAAVLNFFGGQVNLIIVALSLGVDVAGVFRAIQNFVLPVNQVLVAISFLALPILSFEYGRSHYVALKRKGLVFTAVLTFFTLLYELFLVIFYKDIELFLYAGKFSDYANLIPIFGVVTLFTGMETGVALIIRSLQKSKYHAIYGLIGAVSALIFTPVMCLIFGVTGAVISQLIVNLCLLLGTVAMYFAWAPRSRSL